MLNEDFIKDIWNFKYNNVIKLPGESYIGFIIGRKFMHISCGEDSGRASI